MNTTHKQHLETLAIHAGQPAEPVTGAITPPVFMTSTYVQDGPGGHKGYEYSRTHNPTRQALEANLAALEGGTHGVAFASGCAATTTILHTLSAGDHVVAGDDLYGGTYRIFERVMKQLGVSVSYVDPMRPAAFGEAIRPNTKLMWIETPTNPLLKLCDIAQVAAICKTAGLPLFVDNTFMSPYFQRPLELGADVVIHSTTKFLNGHSDSIGGTLVAKSAEHGDWFYFVQKSEGAILSPFDSFLVLRGIKTLAVRMERHETNGRALAAYLAQHPKVQGVFYPGLPDHPGHALQQRQSSGFGALITFELGSYAAAKKFLDAVEVMSLAESLGGVETLTSHPASMTHASVPADKRAELGITDGLVRISAGIEDLADLLADTEQALAKI